MHLRVFIYLFLHLCTYQLTVAMQNDNRPHVIERTTQALSTDEYILVVAAAEGEVDMITLCLDAGAKVDCIGAQNATPLMEAAQQGHF